MTPIEEGSLRFEFGSSWEHVYKYDGHSIYTEGIGKLTGNVNCEKCETQVICPLCSKPKGVGTKAVDIIGLYQRQFYFIEIKDFRGSRIENKKRLKDGHLAFEVALKVRDTLAGLLGVIHRGDEWKPILAPMLKLSPRIVLWLEEDLPPGALKTRGGPDPTISNDLRKKLRWLNTHVLLTSIDDNRLPDVNVVRLSKTP